MCLSENVRRKFDTPKPSIGVNATISHHFVFIRVSKCSITLPNIIMGIIEVIGCVRAKTFVGTLVPQNRAFGYQNAPVSHHFAC